MRFGQAERDALSRYLLEFGETSSSVRKRFCPFSMSLGSKEAHAADNGLRAVGGKTLDSTSSNCGFCILDSERQLLKPESTKIVLILQMHFECLRPSRACKCFRIPVIV